MFVQYFEKLIKYILLLSFQNVVSKILTKNAR